MPVESMIGVGHVVGEECPVGVCGDVAKGPSAPDWMIVHKPLDLDPEAERCEHCTYEMPQKVTFGCSECDESGRGLLWTAIGIANGGSIDVYVRRGRPSHDGTGSPVSMWPDEWDDFRRLHDDRPEWWTHEDPGAKELRMQWLQSKTTTTTEEQA